MYTAEGTIASWKKPHGSRVDAGDIIVEIETEKAVQELEAPLGGILHHVLNEGAKLQVETLLGFILQAGEAVPSESPSTSNVSTSSAVSAPVPAQPAASRVSPDGELRVSPIARRLAQEHGIDLTAISGSGPGGRIVEADVRAVIGSDK